jgi:hypothetical protein
MVGQIANIFYRAQGRAQFFGSRGNRTTNELMRTKNSPLIVFFLMIFPLGRLGKQAILIDRSEGD